MPGEGSVGAQNVQGKVGNSNRSDALIYLLSLYLDGRYTRVSTHCAASKNKIHSQYAQHHRRDGERFFHSNAARLVDSER